MIVSGNCKGDSVKKNITLKKNKNDINFTKNIETY